MSVKFVAAATYKLGGPVLDKVGDVVDTELQDDGLQGKGERILQ